MSCRLRTACLTLLGTGLLATLGCGGAATPIASLSPTGDATAPIAGADLTGASRENEPGVRESATVNLTGKWFGKLKQFNPAEPPLNSWNIDLDLVQNGHEVRGVVIMSELIPIAVNIWDVFIRLDASTYGVWNGGEARLHMFQDVKAGDSEIGGVVNMGFPKAREMEYVEAVITGVENNTLQGHLVIHWRNPYDLNAGWTQVCHFSEVTPVAQGSGGGGD